MPTRFYCQLIQEKNTITQEKLPKQGSGLTDKERAKTLKAKVKTSYKTYWNKINNNYRPKFLII